MSHDVFISYAAEDKAAALETVGHSRGVKVPETKAQRQWIEDFSSLLAHT